MTNDLKHRPTRMPSIPSHRPRRIVLWLTLVILVVIVQFYFTSWDPYILQNTFEVFRHKNPPVAVPSSLHVLLVTYARTGSSFVGDLIQSLPSTFYHFEPLHFIRGSVLNGSFDEARDLLDNLFKCNISRIEGFIEWQMKHKSFMKFQRNIHYWEECSKNNSCYNGTYIDSFCSNRTIKIAKTIRLNLLEASKLFTSHPHLNLKIIYLTRDPRGTMNSRMKKPVNSWCRHDVMCSNPHHFCSGLQTDVETTCFLIEQKPNDFLVIRYEDLSADPYGAASQISKFLGFSSVPDQVQKFLKTHTYFVGNVKRRSKAQGLEYPYTTFRNSSITAMKWRKEMAFRTVMELQRNCNTFLSGFGYHSYRTVSALRSNVDLNSDLQKALDSTCEEKNR